MFRTRSRRLIRVALSLGFSFSLAAALPALAQPQVEVTTATEVLDGAVGGVAVDALGYLYVANFGNEVWRVSPFGEVEVFAKGLYGASGNAVDPEGRLLQASFHGGTLHRFDRTGEGEVLARGLKGPVGIAVDPDSGDAIVCACRGNLLHRVAEDGTVETFAESDLFRCPNGIVRSPDGTFHVVNFSDGSVLEVSPEGEVSLLATLPGGGLGHVTRAGDHLYVTGCRSNRVYRVAEDGSFSVLAGSGAFGTDDGPGEEATFATPNGIAYDATRDRLYLNDYPVPFLRRTVEPPQSVVRRIAFPGLTATLRTALDQQGPGAVAEAYDAYRKRRSGYFAEIETNVLGYALLGEGRIDDAIAVLEANVAAYPQSANAHDSLGEAYMAAGRKEESAASYRRSLELNPLNRNAEEKLRELGVEP